MTRTKNRTERAIHRIADGTDLTIDLMTLGQYGLERVAADGEECGPKQTDWEAPRPARRRGDCDWRAQAPAWTASACS